MIQWGDQKNFLGNWLVSSWIGSRVIKARLIEAEKEKNGKTIVHSKTVVLISTRVHNFIVHIYMDD